MNGQEKILNKMVEVTIKDREDFSKIRETLERIGIPSKDRSKLFQSCHILSKRGKYYITHFKLLFGLDGKYVNLKQDDEARMNSIALLLEEWGMLKIVNREKVKELTLPVDRNVKIIKHEDRENWELVPKYNIGNRKSYNKYPDDEYDEEENLFV